MVSKRLEERKNFLNLTQLIRSIQRVEGNPDCFRRSGEWCENLGCSWREYCLEDTLCIPFDKAKQGLNKIEGAIHS